MKLQQYVEHQRRYFASGRTLSADFRREQLNRLRLSIRAHEAELLSALRTDLGKSLAEGYMTELSLVYGELDFAIRRLKHWTAPRRVFLPLAAFPGTGWVHSVPYGCVLIMSPWNYPVQLTLNPLVAALAAGNCALIKPSAYAPAVSSVLARLIAETFPSAYVSVVEGGRRENAALLEQHFDLICFTGGAAVGRTVMEAASRHLTPVILELGGKSPAVVDHTADLKTAARRLIWGKTVNAGQTCVAPDYVLADRRIAGELTRELIQQSHRMWGRSPLTRADYPHIVNEKHFNRLTALLEGQHILSGGGSDRAALRIEPTVLQPSSLSAPVMQEEIFGPLLPVLACDSLEEAACFIRHGPRPLALYIFTSRRETARRFLTAVPSGGACVNDVLLHLTSPRLPFGGVGDSGMGRYHGKAGFDAFSYEKSVVERGTRLDIPLRYPPYTEGKRRLLCYLLPDHRLTRGNMPDSGQKRHRLRSRI
ncbi:MAG: aldehyde dehydrogenase [Clostridiales bacterium]|nr:aldehyde dehydrogenase [Clostridiales bacterium]